MTNKKDSELDAITSLAAGDLLRVVDVSDTTMASSGTNKIITAANAGLVPGSLSRLIVQMTDDITPITGGSSTSLLMDNVVEQVGSDFSITNGDTQINILTDGVYSVSCRLDAYGTAGDVLSARFDVTLANLLSFTDIRAADANGEAGFSFGATYYMAASSTVTLLATLFTTSDPWTLASGSAGQVNVQRLA